MIVMTEIVNDTELGILSVFLAAGADPNRLARWVCENADTETSVESMTAAATAMGRGMVVSTDLR